MASKKYYFYVTAMNNVGNTGNWDEGALESRLNSHPGRYSTRVG